MDLAFDFTLCLAFAWWLLDSWCWSWDLLQLLLLLCSPCLGPGHCALLVMLLHYLCCGNPQRPALLLFWTCSALSLQLLRVWTGVCVKTWLCICVEAWDPSQNCCSTVTLPACEEGEVLSAPVNLKLFLACASSWAVLQVTLTVQMIIHSPSQFLFASLELTK